MKTRATSCVRKYCRACSSEGTRTASWAVAGVDGGADGAERVMTILRRSLRGRNLGGIESQVLRPMMTALSAVEGAYDSHYYYNCTVKKKP